MRVVDSEWALLEAAAKPTRNRINKDIAGVSAQFKKVLEQLKGNLFDPALNLKHLCGAFGLSRPAIRCFFRDELRTCPQDYISHHRMETAERLIRDTDLKIWRIAKLTGYPNLSNFGSIFHRRFGERPKRYREKFQRASHEMVAFDEDLRSGIRLCRMALVRATDPSQSLELKNRLLSLYPFLRKTPQRHMIGAAHYSIQDRRLAEKVWNSIKNLSYEEQRNRIRHQEGIDPYALADLLREKSREEGRLDRRRGIEVATLMMESLEGREEILGVVFPQLRAYAWTWISNAHRLAYDFSGAERALSFAVAEWESAQAPRDPLIEAEILENQTTLLWFRRRFVEALALANRAVILLRPLNQAVPLAQALILRACIHQHAGVCSSAVADLREALVLLDEQQNPYLALTAYLNLSKLHIDAGNHADAKEALDMAKVLCGQVGDPSKKYYIQWQEGMIKEAEGQPDSALQDLLEARYGFINSSDLESVAVVSWDLAIVYAKLNRHPEAVSLASEVVGLFDTFKIEGEAFAALKFLRDTIESRGCGHEVLLEARSRLLRIIQDPVVLVSFRCREEGVVGTSAGQATPHTKTGQLP